MVRILLFFLYILSFSNVMAFMPITTDARIKTIIYSPTEIFKLKFHPHFQSYIEFPIEEKFKVISIGDNYSFEVNQVENRLFIRPKLAKALTNMTIITSKRAYHFELYSSDKDIYETDAELVYVAKFYYPDQAYDFMQTVRLKKPLEQYKIDQFIAEQNSNKQNIPEPINNDSENMIDNYHNVPFADKEKPISNESMSSNIAQNQFYNYAYSMTGIESQIMPLKVFDDGINTYIEFNRNILPDIYLIDENNNAKLAEYSVDQSLVVINKVTDRFMVMDNINKICIYNDNYNQASPKAGTEDSLNLNQNLLYMK